MIPLALVKLGGWSEFTARVPEHMLSFFGSGLDEFSLGSIAAFLLANYIIGITGHQGNMAHNGSAKDEITARVGGLGGNYTKTSSYYYVGVVRPACFCSLPELNLRPRYRLGRDEQ